MMTKTNVSDTLDEFSNEASIHGAPRIIRAETRCSRGFWTLIFGIAVGMFCFHFGSLLTTYLKFPTSISFKYEVNRAVFPSVTICSTNPFSTLGLHHNERFRELAEKYHEEVLVPLYFYLGNISGSAHFQDVTMEIATKQKYIFLDKYFGTDLLLNSALQPEKFFVLCRYMGSICDPKKFFKIFVRPDFYNCFVFEHDLEKSIAGHEHGLSLVIFSHLSAMNPLVDINREVRSFSEEGRNFYTFSDTGGSIMAIHAKHTLPQFKSKGVTILPGQHVKVSFKEEVFLTEATPLQNCTDTELLVEGDEIHMTLDSCQELCYQKAVLSECKCYDPGFFNPDDIATTEDPCWSHFYDQFLATNFTCNNNSKDECFEAIHSFLDYCECPSKFQQTFNSSECICDESCEDITYPFSSSQDPWPQPINSQMISRYEIISQIFNKKYISQFNSTEWEYLQSRYWPEVNQSRNDWAQISLERQREILSHFSVVDVFFSDTNLKVSKEERSYEFVNLISDIGGTFGLWVGMSLISTVEVAYLCIALCHACKNYSRTRTIKVSDQGKKENNLPL